MNALEKAEQLKQELESLRPLDAEAEARIMQKFRLDWNYHSNKLEGNSLTFGETKALLLHGITAGTKPLKDYLEIEGHDEAIKWVEELIKDARPLNETFICQLHTLILVKPYQVDAITPDGQPTKRLINIGKYKTQPNHVLTQTGEMFYFAEPFVTPIKMRELIEWFREKNETDINPILLSAEFHYKFIRIHPFDDGNGRIARILGNFILMQNGYPPLIIKTEDKQNYILALQQADAGIYEPFFEYIANNVIYSLEIMVRGAKGESIEESEDLDKELALLEHKLKGIVDNNEIEKTQENLLFFFDNSVVPLFLELGRTSQKFARFYYENQSVMIFDGGGISSDDQNRILNKMREQLVTSKFSIKLQHDFRRFKTGENINYQIWLEIELNPKKIIIKNSDNKIIFEKSYSNQLSEDEIKRLVNFEAKKHKDFIEKQVEKKSI
jgi:Fic family protein